MYAHVGLNVTNLENSIAFYTKLFGQEPVKVKADYAKFLVADPGLNFTLNVRSEVSGNQINHFGFQVADTDEVLRHKARLEESGLETLEEMNTTCCYAVQDKFWVRDPDGHNWEFFFPKQDAAARYEVESEAGAAACTCQTACCA